MIRVIARTSDPEVYVVELDGVRTVEKTRYIPNSAFPVLRSRKWSNGLVSGRIEVPEERIIAMSDQPEFNLELYPAVDCFLVEGDQERPLETLKQIRELRKHGYRETLKQGKARRIREANQAADLLEALGFEVCSDCAPYWKAAPDYHNPADLIAVRDRDYWGAPELKDLKLCRVHYAQRLGSWYWLPIETRKAA